MSNVTLGVVKDSLADVMRGRGWTGSGTLAQLQEQLTKDGFEFSYADIRQVDLLRVGVRSASSVSN